MLFILFFVTFDMHINHFFNLIIDVFITVDIFKQLKENQPEPDPEKVISIEEVEEVETQNFTAIEILRQLPGITDGNIKGVIEKVRRARACVSMHACVLV